MGVTEKQPTYLRLQVRVEVSDESDVGVQSHPGDSEGAPPSLAQSSLDWLSAQIALGKTPDAVYPLIAERLANPQKIFTRSDQIQLLTDCVRYGRANAEAMSGADAVIILGNTGAGKSTFINYLAGCELEVKRIKGRRKLEVRGTASGGVRDEVTPIGHGGSQTFMPQIASVGDRVYCDCPGFSDNRGAEINIVNAVNIKQALSQAKSLRLVVLVDYRSLDVDRGNSFQALLRTLTDLLGSEATIAKHKGSILLGISQCPDPDMTREELWLSMADHVPENLQCLKECLFLFNPLSPEAGWDRTGCLAALDRLAKVSDPSSILSVSLNDSALYALHSLVDAMGEEIASALSGGDLASASARYRSLDRLSVIDHEKIKSLLSSTRSRISSWVREQEGKFRFQYAMHDFEGAKNLLDLLREVSVSLGASEVDLSLLRAELDSAREAYEVQQAQVSALERELSSLRAALSENADKVESNHAQVLNLFEQQQASISEQLKSQELAFGRRMELLEGQLRTQEASYTAKVEEMAAAHKSELSRREAEIRQEVRLSAAEQAEKLLSLQQELEARYQSEQQAQEARHSQAVALLAAEKSAAKQALHTENRKVIADQKRLLSDQQQAYEKLLGELKQKEEALKDSQSTNQTLSAKNLALQDELKILQSSLPQSPSGVVSGPQTPPNVTSSSRPALSPAAATLSSFGDSVLDASVWERYYGAVDSSPSPPSGIDQILNSPCPFWRGKQVKDTHLLALIPSRVAGKPLTLDYLGELIKSPKGGGHKTQYRGYYVEDIGNQSPGKSYWVLMTRDVLDGSRNKSYKDQCALVARHRGYTVPGVLEAAVVMLLHHVRSGERLYSDSPWTYTRCQESVVVGGDDYSVVVGGFSSGGLFVSSICSFVRNDLGVAGLRKF
jgi:energy-coupling factor transporter ATP-binding protein EcfA2